MDQSGSYIKGRGSLSKPQNRFIKHEHVLENEFLNYCHHEGEIPESNRTEIIEVFPKTIINKITSPDIGMDYSMNPYQGCEHGCVYCYARNSHEYWGYNAGLDFERKILVKRNAPQLLKKALSSRKYEPKLIMLSGNTDCYQPIERRLKITHELLKICLDYRNPVGIITKNALVLRDLDILKELNELKLLRITLSITSLRDSTRRVLEPRTSSVKNKLKTLETLSKNGIDVNVNMAPIIPAINDDEIFELVETVGSYGAKSVVYIIVRLAGQLGNIFESWLEAHFPDRKDKVLNILRSMRNGKLNDSRFGPRMHGEGLWADHIRALFTQAKKRFIPEHQYSNLNFEDFRPLSHGQLKLF